MGIEEWLKDNAVDAFGKLLSLVIPSALSPSASNTNIEDLEDALGIHLSTLRSYSFNQAYAMRSMKPPSAMSKQHDPENGIKHIPLQSPLRLLHPQDPTNFSPEANQYHGHNPTIFARQASSRRKKPTSKTPHDLLDSTSPTLTKQKLYLDAIHEEIRSPNRRLNSPPIACPLIATRYEGSQGLTQGSVLRVAINHHHHNHYHQHFLHPPKIPPLFPVQTDIHQLKSHEPPLPSKPTRYFTPWNL